MGLGCARGDEEEREGEGEREVHSFVLIFGTGFFFSCKLYVPRVA